LIKCGRGRYGITAIPKKKTPPTRKESIVTDPNSSQPAPAEASWLRRQLKIVLPVGVILTAILITSACSTVSRTVLMPPKVVDSEFVGSASCAQCHEEITRDFHTASHALLQAKGSNASEMGCESCHGPGSKHNESGGAYHTIVNPKKSPDVCFQCHLDLKGQFSLPSHHPIMEGKMSCTDCHNPHKGRAAPGGAGSLLSDNQLCQSCHLPQRGPFVFEHEASREGCTTCHRPHGSVNQRMLTERNSTLCLKCHFQQQTITGQVLIGGRDHAANLSRGTCWSAGCHEAVHGSQINSSLRF
jgi:predicted CXXCH cytochrome family protein